METLECAVSIVRYAPHSKTQPHGLRASHTSVQYVSNLIESIRYNVSGGLVYEARAMVQCSARGEPCHV